MLNLFKKIIRKWKYEMLRYSFSSLKPSKNCGFNFAWVYCSKTLFWDEGW